MISWMSALHASALAVFLVHLILSYLGIPCKLPLILRLWVKQINTIKQQLDSSPTHIQQTDMASDPLEAFFEQRAAGNNLVVPGTVQPLNHCIGASE
jgi:hypothetical protein